MKKITAFFVAISMIFAFSGCIKQETKTYDADIIADTLYAGLTFGESLEKSTAEAAYSIYGLDPSLCTAAAIYVGSGATADEVAVFNCTDSIAAETVMQAINSRKEYLKEGYSDYGPDQVPKIEAAAIISSVNTVIMCICENPESVNDILESID
ncbi:MAG: DUF4358 domain-containing protein [Clostridia bacterium]|nr:DUF4358 domain-containing protein [Clostridia bacterium]